MEREVMVEVAMATPVLVLAIPESQTLAAVVAAADAAVPLVAQAAQAL
jgi:hypothetical protein